MRNVSEILSVPEPLGPRCGATGTCSSCSTGPLTCMATLNNLFEKNMSKMRPWIVEFICTVNLLIRCFTTMDQFIQLHQYYLCGLQLISITFNVWHHFTRLINLTFYVSSQTGTYCERLLYIVVVNSGHTLVEYCPQRRHLLTPEAEDDVSEIWYTFYGEAMHSIYHMKRFPTDLVFLYSMLNLIVVVFSLLFTFQRVTKWAFIFVRAGPFQQQKRTLCKGGFINTPMERDIVSEQISRRTLIHFNFVRSGLLWVILWRDSYNALECTRSGRIFHNTHVKDFLCQGGSFTTHM
jgi:hypothetical protein